MESYHYAIRGEFVVDLGTVSTYRETQCNDLNLTQDSSGFSGCHAVYSMRNKTVVKIDVPFRCQPLICRCQPRLPEAQGGAAVHIACSCCRQQECRQPENLSRRLILTPHKYVLCLLPGSVHRSTEALSPTLNELDVEVGELVIIG